MDDTSKKDGFLTYQAKSFNWAFEGIIYSFDKGTHLKMQILAAALVTILGVVLSISVVEWSILVLTASAVICAEIINTAIEETCDILHPELHPKAKQAKHAAAGAVLVTSIAAVVVGILIFLPKILS